MKIVNIIVDEVPESCGDCCLMDYLHGVQPVCYGISDKEKREITGNPYDMTYRRSDCPLEKAVSV